MEVSANRLLHSVLKKHESTKCHNAAIQASSIAGANWVVWHVEFMAWLLCTVVLSQFAS